MSTGFTLGESTGATLGNSTGGTLGNPEENYLIDGQILPTQTTERATYQSLTLGFRVSTRKLTDVLRPLKPNQDQISILGTDDGGYVSVDRSNTNTYHLTPPPSRQPLRREGTYRVRRYEEDLVSQSVDEWQVSVEFVPDANRSDVHGISVGGPGNDPPEVGADAGATLGESTGFTLGGDSGASLGNTRQAVPPDYWGLTTRYGTIATDRVDADFLGTGEDGVERYELTVRLSFEQSLSFESALARLGGVRVRNVPDSNNEAVDDTTGDVSTVTVDSPTERVVSDGEYVVTGWESTRLNDAYQEISLEVAVST